jgi:beta-galactosidase GanA
MVRLWTLETFAASGDMVNYFRWCQVPYAQEQTLLGLHISDGSQDDGYFKVQDVALHDLPVLNPEQSLQGYEMVAVPNMPVVPASFSTILSAYNGPIIFGPRSATLTDNFSCGPGIQPSPGVQRDRLLMRVTLIEMRPEYANGRVLYDGNKYK